MPGDHIRQFAKMFTNLTPGQRAEFERAIGELQDSQELSSLESSLELLKRSPNQNLPIPQVSVEDIIRGGYLSWDALPDQRVNFYEIDVSNTNNFASFDTITTFGLDATIEGLTSSVFVRVRGVRRDGTTTPYSETVTIQPQLFDVLTHQDEEFYVPIVGTAPNTIVGGPNSTLDYTPINPNASSMIWGFVTMYADPAVAMLGLDVITAEIQVKIKDTSTGEVSSDDIVWKSSFGEFWSSTALGPIAVQHPEAGNNIEISLNVTDATVAVDASGAIGVRSEDNTEVFWGHLNVVELGID